LVLEQTFWHQSRVKQTGGVSMKEHGLASAACAKRYIRKGSFVAEITVEDNLFRFVIRDESRTRPSIHGSKKSMQEMESEVRTVLDRLNNGDRAA
jgi:hypothetical protein